MLIKHSGNLFLVTKTEHITPGKGNAIMQVFVKEIIKKKSMKLRFRSSEDVDVVHFELEAHQFLYKSGDVYHFMNLQDYNQVEIEKDFIGDGRNFLREDLEVQIAFYEGNPIHLEFPKAVLLEVTYCEPWIKGDSVSNNLKPVTLETGYILKVPLFINQGDTIRVNTEKGTYLERIERKSK